MAGKGACNSFTQLTGSYMRGREQWTSLQKRSHDTESLCWNKTQWDFETGKDILNDVVFLIFLPQGLNCLPFSRF